LILDVAPTELLVLGAVALLVIPPKDLPRAMRFAGQWIGKARGLARQFRSGFDDMIREAEFAEMEKKWKAENERIMREFPQAPDLDKLMAPDVPALPSPADDVADGAELVAQPDFTPTPPADPAATPKAEPAGTRSTTPRARKKAASAAADKPVKAERPAAAPRPRKKAAQPASPAIGTAPVPPDHD